MTKSQPEKPVALTIDVDQWRRDIATFADTTKQALDAIAAELSNGCSGNTSLPAEYRSATRSRTISAPTSTSRTSLPESSSGEDRLAKLKDQLAQRISKSN